jgi:hypothetical protein
MGYHHYAWETVPAGHRTRKQWLKRRRRLKKGAGAVGTITLVFDRPRSRPRHVEPVPPEECEQVRERLRRHGPGDSHDLWRLDRAGQLAVCHLYGRGDTEAITRFREAEAQELLGYLVWDHSHEDHYITETTVDGKRQRATWRSEVSAPDLSDHLSGERYFGVKKGRLTMQVTVDLDRHSGAVPAADHVAKALAVGGVLARRFPRYRFAPEVNPANGSVKFFGWLPEFTPVAWAERAAEQVRRVLAEELPGYDFGGLEVFPSSCPQVFAPLRADKTMVIGGGPVKRVKRYRMAKAGGKRRREYYESPSCAAYLNWVFFSEEPYDAGAFEGCLREAVARCPDTAGAEPPRGRAKGRKKESAGGGMGDIGRLKGRCAATLVNFWSELDVPPDDTLGKYVIVTLRVLKHEGLEADQAEQWVEERLQALEYTEFSDRLTEDFAEVRRVTGYAVGAVWDGNGYQPDPRSSDAKLAASVAAWAGKGFRLHDPNTWLARKPAANSASRLEWTPALLGLLPGLAAVARCDVDQAKRLLEEVLTFVESHNELAQSMVGRLLGQVGVKGRSRQKQHEVRKFLVESGLLVKRYNYYWDRASGYRHGNFYVCGPAVTFAHQAGAIGPPPPPPYLFLSVLGYGSVWGGLAGAGPGGQAAGLRGTLPGEDEAAQGSVQGGGVGGKGVGRAGRAGAVRTSAGHAHRRRSCGSARCRATGIETGHSVSREAGATTSIWVVDVFHRPQAGNGLLGQLLEVVAGPEPPVPLPTSPEWNEGAPGAPLRGRCMNGTAGRKQSKSGGDEFCALRVAS